MVNSWEHGLLFINPVTVSQNEVEGLELQLSGRVLS